MLHTHSKSGRPLFDGWAAGNSVWLALYWPLYGALFYLLERAYQPDEYHVMYTPLDDMIPFCEWFAIPYVFWFLFLLGIHLWTARYNAAAFKRLMTFVAISHTCSLLIFFLFPTCQQLRPLVLPRENLLTQIVAFFYRIDTSTNVCPSLHVVGSMAVWYAARDTALYARRPWRVFFDVTTLLICLSTVFLKQHSVLDVVAGLALSALVYRLVYRPRRMDRAPAISQRWGTRRRPSWRT